MSRVFPLTLALSPNTKNVLGEREQIVGTLTQGGTSGSCRWCRPGLPSDAPLGLYREEAASCRFTNVQSPGGTMIESNAGCLKADAASLRRPAVDFQRQIPVSKDRA